MCVAFCLYMNLCLRNANHFCTSCSQNPDLLQKSCHGGTKKVCFLENKAFSFENLGNKKSLENKFHILSDCKLLKIIIRHSKPFEVKKGPFDGFFWDTTNPPPPSIATFFIPKTVVAS